MNQLVILAGGKGTRLGAETRFTPKPLVTLVDGLTFLDVLLRRYSYQFSDVLVFAGYRSEMIEEHVCEFYSSSSTSIRVLVEGKPAGTAGAFLEHQEELEDQFFVINGDTWFDFDIGAVRLQRKSSVAKLVVTEVADVSRYGSVIHDNDERVIGFIEKSDSEGSGSGFINTGCYLMTKSVVDYIPGSPSSLERDVFPRLVELGLLEGVSSTGSFLDIGLPETLAFARNNREFFNI